MDSSKAGDYECHEGKRVHERFARESARVSDVRTLDKMYAGPSMYALRGGLPAVSAMY